MKNTARRMMVDEIAYHEAAVKVLLDHDKAAIEAEALHWIISHVLAKHCALLFHSLQP